MAEPEIIEDFYGVYLLYNINPKFKGRTYIGYTRNPNRRIMQHNRGTWAGGAHRTSNKGPWKMVMIVHGFPNNISALRFEWAWQNPNKTTRLQHLNLKKVPRKESEFQFKLRVLSEMLRVGPWVRLPLVIRWLETDFREEFPYERKPPDHMTTCQGPIKCYNLKKAKDVPVPTVECLLCAGYLKETEKLTCVNTNCDLVSHITCLADLFLSPEEFIPIHGLCPFCKTKLKWGDLIRRMKGCKGGPDANYEDDTKDDDGDVICTQDRLFVDNLNDYQHNGDDDLVCMQDDLSMNDVQNDDDIVSRQDRLVVDNLNDNHQYDDDVVCTQALLGNLDDDKWDSDEDEVIFKPKTVNDDQPSWFLDCNEDL